MDPETVDELRRGQEMHDFIAANVAGEYQSDDRASIFASFLSLAQSHHEAIIVLCQHQRLIGSAYALMRPLVEVTNRGLFTAILATPEQIEHIKQGGSPYGTFNELAARLDAAFQTDGIFTGHGGEAWKTMCGLAHGGLEQLNRRVGKNGEIGCHFDQGDIRRLLSSSTSVLFKIAFVFLAVMGREAESKAVNAKYIALYSDSTQSWQSGGCSGPGMQLLP